ncbi:BRD4 [Mytilus coruscus]|uniref:Methionine adenosyltransferase 2 subunit beta n=1 Tax=Mytilus coruscus TaxID=42192 RepID=A0A6J8DTU5_MYTCO|nr:BRD4 [Mytilus coruscus]
MEVSQDNSILRVPILYGDIEYLDESAVTTLFQKVTNSSKPCPMSDYERRFPTHCDDIAYVIRQLAEKRIVLEVASCTFSKCLCHYHSWRWQAAAFQSVYVTITAGGGAQITVRGEDVMLQCTNYSWRWRRHATVHKSQEELERHATVHKSQEELETSCYNAQITVKGGDVMLQCTNYSWRWRRHATVHKSQLEVETSCYRAQILVGGGDSYMWPFYQPVDPIALGLYDYFEIVKKPMDLSTIKNNLECCLYKSVDEFSDDMRLLYQNCYLYSEPDTEIYKMAKQLQEYFEKTMKTTISDKPVGINSHTENSSPGKEMSSAMGQFTTGGGLQFTVVLFYAQDKSIKGVYHWSGDENMTKYDMALVMADVFSLPSDHIQPDKKPSSGASRPFNSQLSCQRLKDLGIAKNSQFKSKILDVLKPYYKP